MQLMSHHRIAIFYRSTCELFEIPPLERCESLDHPTHTDLAPVWAYEFDPDGNERPNVYRLLDTNVHLNDATILSWNLGRHHSLITLPADISPPSVVKLPSLAFWCTSTDRTARFRSVMPHRDSHDLTLVTNDTGDNTAHLVNVDFISELKSLILDGESLYIELMDMDEGTGRVCFVFRRRYQEAFGAVKSRALTNFIVLLDFMAQT
jgi:hypothetical protein